MGGSYTKKIVLLCSLLLCAFDLAAETRFHHRHWEIGPEVYHITYEEPGVMRKEGIMHGLRVAFRLHEEILGPVNMFRVEAGYAWGSLDYSSDRTGVIDGIDTSVFEIRSMLGHDIKAASLVVVTPYVGFGYRRKKDDAGGLLSSTGALGYDRKSCYAYSPVGVAVVVDLEKGWSVGGFVEYDFFWDGTQKSYFGGFHPLNSDLVNDQDEGYGIRASLKVVKQLDNSSLMIAVEPFLRYWDIQRSDTGYYDVYNPLLDRVVKKSGYEPENNSVEYGVNVSLHF